MMTKIILAMVLMSLKLEKDAKAYPEVSHYILKNLLKPLMQSNKMHGIVIFSSWGLRRKTLKSLLVRLRAVATRGNTRNTLLVFLSKFTTAVYMLIYLMRLVSIIAV